MRLAAAVAFCTFASQTASGQQSSADSVARAFIAALNTGNWRAAAALTDSGAVMRLHATEIARAQIQRPDSAALVARLLKDNPTMPRVVAEYSAGMRSDFPEEQHLYQQFGVCSASELAGLSLQDFAARWLEGHDEEVLARRAFEWEGYTTRPDPAYPVRSRTRWVLATVVEAKRAFAVVAESAVGSDDFSPYILELRNQSGRWRVLPTHGINGFGLARLAVTTEVVGEGGAQKPPRDRDVACPQIRRARAP